MTIVERVTALERSEAAYRDKVTRLIGESDAVEKALRRESGRSEELLEAAQNMLLARLLLETYSEEEQERLVRAIEKLAARGMQVIFGPGYGFRIEVATKRNRASMEFFVVTPEGEHDPLEAHGGGVVNVVALVLRLVVTALTPSLGRVIILDEPFAQLSAGYLEGMGRFLRELVEVTGIQFVIVTHEPEIVAASDAAYRVWKDPERGTLIEKES